MNRVLIIVPCLNEEAYLGDLIHGLVRNSAGIDAQIIIADGNSTDSTAEIARNLAQIYPNVTYLLNSKKLQSAAVNLAVSSFGADADYLIRIDAHASYPDDFLKVLIEETTVTNADSVVVSMDTQGKTLFQKAVAKAQNSRLGNGGSAHRNISSGQWVDHGHHALMRISSFRAVGGYDENFSHNEDAELDLRLRQEGYKIWLTGKTKIIYYPRSTPSSLFRQYFKFGEGRARTVIKHRIFPRIRQMIPLLVAPSILMLPLLFWHLIFAVPFLIWFGVCIGSSGLQVGSAIMIMHLAWSLGFWRYALTHIGDQMR